MLSRETLQQIHRLQLRARRAVEDLLGGEYHSVFKGTGIAFDEVREYQPGDDVRSIDWNVTARMGHPFVKRYVEERELTVMLMVDSSRSQHFGTTKYRKIEVAAEIASVLAFSAISNQDKVGLITFTNQVERYVRPQRGILNGMRIIRDVLTFQPSHQTTSLRMALDFLNRVQRRRAIVFLISDFLDNDFERSLKQAGRRHDLIGVRIYDPREEGFPTVGLIELEDAETGVRLLLDTGNKEVRERFASGVRMRKDSLRHLARAAKIDLIEVSTTGNHLDALIRFFRLRERRLGNK